MSLAVGTGNSGTGGSVSIRLMRRLVAAASVTIQYKVTGLPATGNGAASVAATLQALTVPQLNDAIIASTTAYNAAKPNGSPAAAAITVSSVATAAATVTDVAGTTTATPTPAPTTTGTPKPTTSAAGTASLGGSALAVAAAAVALLGL
jgi:hypothetical protein